MSLRGGDSQIGATGELVADQPHHLVDGLFDAEPHYVRDLGCGSSPLGFVLVVFTLSRCRLCPRLVTFLIAERSDQEGFLRGKAEGKVEGKAEAVLVVLAARRVAVGDAERVRILSEQDPAQLDRWLAKAAICARVAELFPTVGQP